MSLSEEDLIWLRSHPCLNYLELIKRHASGGKDDETWQMILRQAVLGDLTDVEKALVLATVRELREELTEFLNRTNLKHSLENLSNEAEAEPGSRANETERAWEQHSIWKRLDD
ncbi:MAG: hypothetical protein AAF564_05650 [Bacteroidota bacterium]